MKSEITESSGNIFLDLEFPEAEATVLAMRAELMTDLHETIANKRWTHVQAAAELGIGQSRAADLIRGRHEKFSLDKLVALSMRSGRKVKLSIA